MAQYGVCSLLGPKSIEVIRSVESTCNLTGASCLPKNRTNKSIETDPKGCSLIARPGPKEAGKRKRDARRRRAERHASSYKRSGGIGKVASDCCAVCGLPTERGKTLEECNSCGMLVHLECYGVSRAPKSGWYCHPCEYRKELLERFQPNFENGIADNNHSGSNEAPVPGSEKGEQDGNQAVTTTRCRNGAIESAPPERKYWKTIFKSLQPKCEVCPARNGAFFSVEGNDLVSMFTLLDSPVKKCMNRPGSGSNISPRVEKGCWVEALSQKGTWEGAWIIDFRTVEESVSLGGPQEPTFLIRWLRDNDMDRWLTRSHVRGLDRQKSLMTNEIQSVKQLNREWKKKHWIHVSCAKWIPQLSLDPKRNAVVGLDDVPSSSRELKCCVCSVGGVGGDSVCVKCSYEGCDKAFHIRCGRNSGFSFLEEQGDDMQICRMHFCKDHARRPKRKRHRPKQLHKSAEFQEEKDSSSSPELHPDKRKVKKCNTTSSSRPIGKKVYQKSTESIILADGTVIPTKEEFWENIDAVYYENPDPEHLEWLSSQLERKDSDEWDFGNLSTRRGNYKKKPRKRGRPLKSASEASSSSLIPLPLPPALPSDYDNFDLTEQLHVEQEIEYLKKKIKENKTKLYVRFLANQKAVLNLSNALKMQKPSEEIENSRAIEISKTLENYKKLMRNKAINDSLDLHKKRDESGETEDDSEIICCVCGDGDQERGNEILLCDCCNIAVHQKCYGITKVPMGSWFCRRCELHKFGETCCVCGNPNGALKPTNDGRWAHIVCMLSIPEVYSKSSKHLEPIMGVAQINPNRRRLQCFFCDENERGAPQPFITKFRLKRTMDGGCAITSTHKAPSLPELVKASRTGACVKCDYPRCKQAFHPQCARERGVQMEMIDNGSSSSMRVYCETHRTKKRPYKIISYYHEPQCRQFPPEPESSSEEEDDNYITSSPKPISTDNELEDAPYAEVVPRNTCQLCGVKEEWLQNKLLKCSMCKIAIHQSCYGVTSSFKGAEDPVKWLCDPCKAAKSAEDAVAIETGREIQKDIEPKPRQIPCDICHKATVHPVPMKRTVAGGWVHLSCAIWIDETKSKDCLSTVSNIQRIYTARRQPVCGVCKEQELVDPDVKSNQSTPSCYHKMGACIQCSIPDCKETFHPQCALEAGMLRIHVAPTNRLIYCFNGEDGEKLSVYSKADKGSQIVGQVRSGNQVCAVSRMNDWLEILWQNDHGLQRDSKSRGESPTNDYEFDFRSLNDRLYNDGLGSESTSQNPSTAWVPQSKLLDLLQGQHPGELLFSALCNRHNSCYPVVEGRERRKDMYSLRWLYEGKSQIIEEKTKILKREKGNSTVSLTGGIHRLKSILSNSSRKETVELKPYTPQSHFGLSRYLPAGSYTRDKFNKSQGGSFATKKRDRKRKRLKAERKLTKIGHALHSHRLDMLRKLQVTARENPRDRNSFLGKGPRQLWCYCRGTQRTFHDLEGSMFKCEGCGDWFHARCLGLRSHEADWVKLKMWVCPFCTLLSKGEDSEFPIVTSTVQDPNTVSRMSMENGIVNFKLKGISRKRDSQMRNGKAHPKPTQRNLLYVKKGSVRIPLTKELKRALQSLKKKKVEFSRGKTTGFKVVQDSPTRIRLINRNIKSKVSDKESTRNIKSKVSVKESPQEDLMDVRKSGRKIRDSNRSVARDSPKNASTVESEGGTEEKALIPGTTRSGKHRLQLNLSPRISKTKEKALDVVENKSLKRGKTRNDSKGKVSHRERIPQKKSEKGPATSVRKNLRSQGRNRGDSCDEIENISHRTRSGKQKEKESDGKQDKNSKSKSNRLDIKNDEDWKDVFAVDIKSKLRSSGSTLVRSSRFPHRKKRKIDSQDKEATKLREKPRKKKHKVGANSHTKRKSMRLNTNTRSCGANVDIKENGTVPRTRSRNVKRPQKAVGRGMEPGDDPSKTSIKSSLNSRSNRKRRIDEVKGNRRSLRHKEETSDVTARSMGTRARPLMENRPYKRMLRGLSS